MRCVVEDQKATILYVDDEESNLLTFKAAFRRTYTVLTANSPRQAIKLLRETKVQIIITDQRMPEMTGVQFLEAVIPEHPEPIRMILTGFSDIDAIIKAINKGCVFRYLTKPWDLADLQQTINAGLKFYQLMRHKENLFKQMQQEIENQERAVQILKKYNPGHSFDSLTSDQVFKGEFRIITILFSCINWQLNVVEEEKVINNIELLNKCFSIMSEVITRHKGVIDKFIGSSILVLFGAPVSYIDNQDNALLCAEEMREKFEVFRATCPPELAKDLKLFSAIHTGNVVVGNIGSTDRMNYTAIGDAVNVTARVLEIAKSQNKEIIVTESMKDVAEEYSKLEDIGVVQLRGRDTPVHLYSIGDCIKSVKS